MDDKKFYVTTPIYYVNDVPHIGHAYATVAADVAARYHRMMGAQVLFLTGTDEHGQKVEKAAREHGLAPKEHVDKMVRPFKELWRRLDIAYDDFIRTTEERHERVVGAIFTKLHDQGDIYKGVYEGWYCIYEETYHSEADLSEGKCPECGRPVEWLQEESYYFKTSKYAPAILAHIEKHPEFVQPESRRNEVVSFLKSGVEDVSVSRTTFKWGVPVPFDPDHVVYVWFDALINYVTGAGYLLDEPKFKAFWPADIHVIGKDIIKFHAVIWPCMLTAAGVEVPKTVFASGWWTLGAEKISKSRGAVVDPNALIDEFGADALRYFFLREIPFGEDGEFTVDALIRRINFDLANDLGNLLHRTVPMMEKYCDGVVPSGGKIGTLEEDIRAVATGALPAVEQAMETIHFRKALGAIWEVIGRANKYIDEAAPWALARDGELDRLAGVMSTLAETIRVVTLLIAPFMPETAQKMWDQLGLAGRVTDRNLSETTEWGIIPAGTRVKKAPPLFPRIETD